MYEIVTGGYEKKNIVLKGFFNSNQYKGKTFKKMRYILNKIN